jgi:putative flippase GtrA
MRIREMPDTESLFTKYFILDRRSIIAYLVVGALTAMLYFSVFTGLWQILYVEYRIAVSIAYLMAVSFHFFMNRKITFQITGGNIRQEIARYAVMGILNYLVSMLVLEFSVKILLLSPYLGVLFGIATTLVSGYLLSKHWVFQVAQKKKRLD